MTKHIEVNNLRKSFGKQIAVEDFSFEVNPGEVMAFLGANGSGKTTTIRCLLRIYEPDSGETLVKGQIYHSQLNKFVGYLPEERGIYTKVKVLDLFKYFADLRGIRNEQTLKEVDNYLERVGLAEHKQKMISQLSSGMQQKVQIGITIMHKPEILILDEPFKGLDPVNRQLFIDIFAELNKQLGTSILYSTHVVDEAQKIAQKVVMIKNGRRIAYGEIDDIRSEYGSNNLFVSFSGELPKNDKLYTAQVTGKNAELAPEKGVSANEILDFLLDKKIKLTEFKIDRPSLNEIFIRLNKIDHVE